MAAGGGNNMMQMMMGMMQLKQQQKEADQQAAARQQQGEQAGWTLISSIARRTTDPMMLTKLAAQGEKWGLGKASDILDTIGQIQPDEDTLRSFGAKQGLKAATGVPGMDTFGSSPESQRYFGEAASRVLTGENRGAGAASSYISGAFDTTPDLPTDRKSAVGQVMRARTLTGQGLTENVADVATSGIPDRVFQESFSMAHGFTPTWAQKQASDQGWANYRSEDDYRIGQTAIGLKDADARKAAAGQAGQLDPKNLPDLFNTETRLLNDLQTNLTALSPSDKLHRLRTLRGISQSIRAAGGYSPDFDENEALRQMQGPGAMDYFNGFMQSRAFKRPY